VTSLSSVAQPVLGRRQRWAGPARRIGWVGIDQMISSLSNAGMTVLVAHRLGARSFGSFAIAFTVYSSLLGVAEAAGGDPFAVRGGTLTGADRDAAVAGASGWPVGFGLLTGLFAVVVGLAMSGDTGHALIALGCFLPFLFVQDSWRLVLITLRRPQAAALNDLSWAVVQFAAIGLLLAAGADHAWVYVIAWGVAAATGAALGVIQTTVVPRLRSVRPWLHAHRDLSVYFAAEWVTVLGASQLAILIVGVVAGVTAVGSLRGGLTLLGPLNVLAVTASTFATPEIARRPLPARTAAVVTAGISGLFVVLVAVWGAALLLAPHRIGVDVLGETWDGTHHLLVPMIVWEMGNLASFGPYAVLRGLGRARSTFVVNAIQAPLLLVGGVVGVLVGGPVGAASGLAAASWLVAPLWVVQVRRAIRELPAVPSEVAAE
jgi:hypothetical protein